MAKSLTVLVSRFDKMYPLGDQPDYEPRPEDNIAGKATASGVAPSEYVLVPKPVDRDLAMAG